MNPSRPRRQRSTLFIIVVTFLCTLLTLVLLGGIVYVFVNFNGLKENIGFNKTFNIQQFEKKVVDWQNEPNRLEIPTLGIIGKISYSKSKEDEEKLLRDSLVHVAGTALPGDKGNVVITGHSSGIYPGDYQSIFATLNKLEDGDKITLYRNNLIYRYQVTGKKVVASDDLSVLDQSDDGLTLLTCWPLGTDMKRLVVSAKVVD